MAFYKDFPYVDATYGHPDSGRIQKWIRILRKEIKAKVIGPSGNLNAFTTIQCFSDAISNRDPKAQTTDQVHYCPLYFDFDAKPEQYGDDVDAARAASHRDAVKLVSFFFQFGVEAPQIKVWFSGNKGFHVTVSPDVFAIKPHKDLTYIIRVVAAYLREYLTLTTLDMSVYSLPRMWRIPDSAHQTTKLYKIELLSNQLATMSPARIANDAKVPLLKHLWAHEENVNVQPIEDAADWFNGFVEHYNAEKELKLLRPKLPVLKTEAWPACVKDILENGLKRSGSRNQATLALAGYFKDTGTPEAECVRILLEWNRRTFGAEGERRLMNRDANAKSVVRSVYEFPQHYRFACQFMLALKGSTPDKRVACVGIPNCPTVNGKTAQEREENQKPNSLPTVSLNQVSSASFNGIPVKFDFHVSGKAKSTYIVPRSLTATCTPAPQTDMCKNCPNVKCTEEAMDETNSAGLRAKRTQNIDHNNRLILSLIDIPDDQKRTKLRSAMGIPSRCMAHEIITETKGEIEKIRIIPLVEDIGIYVPLENIDTAYSGGADGIQEQHMVMQAYHLREPGQDVIRANQKYKAEGIPYESPKDQSATALIYNYQTAQDDISNFKLTPELHKQLKIFQVAKGQSVSEKMDDIHEDLEINVHRIYGRRDVAFSLDMSYHSVLSFWFQEQRIQKGWVELLIIGDTGQGKTEIVKGFIRHYRLGEITGAEGAKRTGLVWAMVQLNGSFELEWGKIPQNDQRLLVIDEFSGMSEENIGQMTRLRSEGIAESQGQGQQQTYARTRLVFLTNPRDGHPMNHYDHGALAVRGLYDSTADARRNDLAIVVAAGDISEDVANQLHGKKTKDHVYTQDLCRNLVLFAWSRREQDIVFEPGTTELILDAAKVIGPKYECSVGLVTTSDQRLKIARLAIACATRLYSVEEGPDIKIPRKIIVRKEHVHFVVNLMNRCYSSKSMQLDRVADKEKKKSKMSASDDKRIRVELRKFVNWQEVVGVLLDNSYLRKDDLSEQSGMSKEETTNFTRWVSRNKLMSKTSGGYRKNPAFTEILKRININGNEDDDDIGRDPGF